ncbi:PadR family transcriptional regulator [Sphingomicrobium arenosum]|uniref:PadR family transcriptional regulator n=1 Tax=Sphingomicrobium arenosum TaxID=2233861 RepID=UPI0022402A2A|nr:PadR family transcriptional regulator [Sphingomicrobium arenosum]
MITDRPLTEIEGAILSEIEHRGQQTAFQVRRAFEASPSREWSGSTGTVYPAIRRLEARGLLHAEETGDKRGARHLSLTGKGRRELADWAMDADRAVSVGMDPFRLRSGIWRHTLAADKRDAIYARLRTALEHAIAREEADITGEDPVEATRIELNILLLRQRLEWLAAEEALSRKTD